MVDDERDLSDLGVRVPEPRLSQAEARAERRALIATFGVEALTGGRDDGPVATARQRGRAMNQMRRECGWRRPSRAAELSRRCDGCGAGPTFWCRRGGRPVAGLICEGR